MIINEDMTGALHLVATNTASAGSLPVGSKAPFPTQALTLLGSLRNVEHDLRHPLSASEQIKQLAKANHVRVEQAQSLFRRPLGWGAAACTWSPIFRCAQAETGKCRFQPNDE